MPNKRKKTVHEEELHEEEGSEMEILPLPPYRNDGKKIPWKRMVVTLKSILDYEGIKAPDVKAYDGKIVVALYYVFHLLKFNIIFRNNRMKKSNTWVITEALRS